ncbi:dUTP diphosphatase [Corynebacterium striatum]|uniref:dUTP diphosphatase n=1 Tax=Corynebacterium striatum TaxID=43770 RepID=UPI00209BD6EC|nr:dUTP diphosphatase [Corynebacterium striatum]
MTRNAAAKKTGNQPNQKTQQFSLGEKKDMTATLALAVSIIALILAIALVVMFRDQARSVKACKKAYFSPVTIDVVGDKANIPARAHAHDAGFDVRINEDVHLAPGERALVTTGIRLGVPDGYYVAAVPRSGMAHKVGVTLNNAPGTIDAGYEGIVYLNLINHSPKHVVLHKGDRVAQLIVQRVQPAVMRRVDSLSGDTTRGTSGHGSTGVK